jgi:hypothetical protein
MVLLPVLAAIKSEGLPPDKLSPRRGLMAASGAGAPAIAAFGIRRDWREGLSSYRT